MITILGLRELLMRKEKGESMPKTWREDVKKYLRNKVLMLSRVENEKKKKEVLLQFEEAKSIAVFLGVKENEW